MDKEALKKKLRTLIGHDRYRHSLSVAKTAARLASIHGVSVERAKTAGLLHDCAKGMERGSLLRSAKRLRLPPGLKDSGHYHLFHSFVSAHLAKKLFGIKDRDVLKAIEHHTSGRAGMSRLEKVIYISDHIAPGRKWPGLRRLRRLAKQNLDKTVALVAEEMIKYLLERKAPIFEQTLTTRNYYLNK
ncbi:MAG: bis(5'-nucleosyl)-tetraphosphatase (symmetrical) YqeK [Candidatus Margulisiibacteriota bacterium]